MSKTTINRDLLLRVLMAAVVLGAAGWVASCTEWVEVELPVPLQGEAKKNHLHVAQQLLRGVGATVVRPSSLSEMPPPRATLLLTSWYWDLFPERAQRLKAWVEGGGHLVIHAGNLNHKQLAGWLPIRRLDPPRAKDEDEEEEEDRDDDADAPAEAPEPAAPPRLGLPRKTPCLQASEADALPAAFADGRRTFSVCTHVNTRLKLQSATPPLWSLDAPGGPLVLRAARGHGRVTVILPWELMDNDSVLKGDNGLATVAALQAGAGTQVWFVTEEDRPPLPAWLWQNAWMVLLLAAAALVLALWRGARRFGPLALAAVPGRRSMTEQIGGTAQFLRLQGPEALLGAQIRALEAVARTHVRHYDKLDRTQRAQAIAKASGLDAAALGLALDKGLARRRTDLPATLQLLETARRLLVQHDRNPRR